MSQTQPRKREVHQTLREFVQNSGPHTTGVELNSDVRWLLWLSFGFLMVPMLLRPLRSSFETGFLWFGDGIAASLVGATTGDVALVIYGVLAAVILVVQFTARTRAPSAPLLATSVASAVTGSVVAIPSTIVVALIIANIVAAMVVTVAIFYAVVMAIGAANS